jgi:hypothetical protein
VLDGQVASSYGIGGEGHAVGGKGIHGAAVHLRICASTRARPGLDDQADLSGDVGLRLHAPCRQRQVAFSTAAVGEADPAALDRFYLCPEV